MKRTFVYITLALVLLLMIGYVYMWRLNHQQRTPKRYKQYEPQSTEAVSSDEHPDFTSFLDDKTDYNRPVYYQQRPVEYQPIAQQKKSTPKRYVTVPVQTSNKYVLTTNNQPYAYATRPSVSSGSSSYTKTSIPSALSMPSAGSPADTTAPDVLGDYASNLTYQQQKDLNIKLKNMSLGVDQAIARAFAPKSKRDETIEKYLQRRGTNGVTTAATSSSSDGTTSATDSPAAQVAAQIASQRNSVVQSMKQAYGNEAAGRANQIMSDFAQEMSDLMNRPIDAQEKQILAQQLNQKYNNKLQKLNKEESAKKMESQLRSEEEKQLAQIRSQFNPETESAIRAKMEENLQKRLKIMQTPQSEEDMYKQLVELEEKQRQDIEAIVQKYNPNDLTAVDKYRTLKNNAIKEQILKESEDVANGAKESRLFKITQETLEQDFKPSWQKEDEAITQGLSAYGAGVQNQASQILQQMRNEQAKIVTEGGDLAEVNRKNMELTEKTNKELQALRDANKETFVQNKAAELNAQNQQRLQHYTTYLSNATEEAKEQWKEQAEPILEKYNQLRAQLLANAEANPNLSDEFNKLGEQEQRELNNIKVQAAQ